MSKNITQENLALHFPTMFKDHQGSLESYPFHHWIIAKNIKYKLNVWGSMLICTTNNSHVPLP
jgi:hypothetical protein